VEFELEMLGRLALAVALGGLVGLERQAHGRPAGLRTHILVCLGSALVMTVTHSFGPNVDPGRAVAGIVTGVGFLGAGVIVKSREIVRGLTTAACIWFVAALGIIVGQGLYVVAAGSTAMALVILTFLNWFSHKIPTVGYHTVVVKGMTADFDALEARCREVFAAALCRVVAVSTHVAKDPESAELTFRLRSRRPPESVDSIKALLSIPDVTAAQWQ
jgi:putative Mg2+ transporter-C (MgtC) family protein